MSSMRQNNYIHADIRLLRSKKARWIAAVICAAVIAVLGAVFVPMLGKYDYAREFTELLYTTTPEDVADPEAKITELRTLASDEVIDHLLEIGGIPAVVLHEAGADTDTWFEFASLTQDQQISDDQWNDAVAGSIRVHDHTANTLRTTWKGALYFYIEKIEGKWMITDFKAVNWQGP